MPKSIDFASYAYYPCLQCSAGELLGYQHLDDADKGAIVPIFEVSCRPPALITELMEVVRKVVDGRPFILDLSHEPAPMPYVSGNPKDPEKDAKRVREQQEYKSTYDAELAELLESRNGFERWRKTVASFPQAIPVLQFNDLLTEQRQILRQASLLLANGSQIAFRLRLEDVNAAVPVVAQILSIVDDARKLLIIVDCGQGRQKLVERAAAASNAILRIRDEIDLSQRSSLRSVCVSSSFTQPPGPYPRDYENYEPELWRAASEVFSFLLGDYAATYRRVSTTTYIPDEWVASVVCPLDDIWLVYRDQNQKDPDGWTKGAAAITRQGKYKDFGRLPGVWGDEVIQRAKEKNIDGVSSARFWHAVKVNIHIHRQIRAAPQRIKEYAASDSED
ncbi:MAG: beta family protein [Parvibaculum sp.]|uniref:beta family protein n=1 Tax=Parvibaculum sp. TaxID=2024848 RepID=UPI0025EF77A2|nr:hypothetical protein [Parvibaculum sp.]MCE9651172.1 beta family protein [Parvibaculum sp.]